MIQQEFLENAIQAALWVLERKDNPPKMVEVYGRLRFEVDGLVLQYQRAGNYAEDDPWVEKNQTTNFYEEGLVVIAKCPRHGGERISPQMIPTRRLSDLELIGDLKGCSHCSAKKVVAIQPAGVYTTRDDLGHQIDSSYRLKSYYCARCASRLSTIPKKSWSKKALRYTEEEMREPTRRALVEVAEWAKDVECRKCVRLTYDTAVGSAGGTYATLSRTYRR